MLRLSQDIQQRTPTIQYVRVPTVLLLLHTYLFVDLSYFLLLIPMCVNLHSRHCHSGSVIEGCSRIVLSLLKRIFSLSFLSSE